MDIRQVIKENHLKQQQQQNKPGGSVEEGVSVISQSEKNDLEVGSKATPAPEKKDQTDENKIQVIEESTSENKVSQENSQPKNDAEAAEQKNTHKPDGERNEGEPEITKKVHTEEEPKEGGDDEKKAESQEESGQKTQDQQDGEILDIPSPKEDDAPVGG